MAAALTASPSTGEFDFNWTQITDVEITVGDATRNVRGAATTLHHIAADNGQTSGANAWVKLYDDVSNALVAGTTAPDFVFPVQAGVVSSTSAFSKGRFGLVCVEGAPFVNGLSVLASTEDGNAMVSAPTKPVDVVVITN